MAFSRVVLLWIHLSLSLASRGDEPNDLVHSAPQSSKLWEAFSATHDWLHVTGPSTVVKAMSQRGQLCSIFIFGLATFCMLRQIYMSFQSLLQGLQQVKKMEEEAPAPMSPATFLAAANEDALRQQRGRAAFRRQMALQGRGRRPKSESAKATATTAAKRCRSV
mmetsp:Transcript_8802/g.10952  ORF Transcript_8802/g.10952 Transcript_8802/m.10952 type:complete len:164 (+) Transcript_8802:76-567(+)